MLSVAADGMAVVAEAKGGVMIQRLVFWRGPGSGLINSVLSPSLCAVSPALGRRKHVDEIPLLPCAHHAPPPHRYPALHAPAVSLTVGRLKLMAEKLFRLKAAQQALLLVPPPGSASQPEDITDEEGRELRYYEVGDGWRVEVGAADAAARAAALRSAKAAAAAEQAARMEAHEREMQALRVEEEKIMG